MLKIISLLNFKGGVGKTTCTVSLGHSLTKHKKKILIIDNDPQCNAGNLLIPHEEFPRYTLYDIYDLNFSKQNILKYIYPTKYKNLWCIPNHPETGSLEAKFFRSEKYPKNLTILRDSFLDYINKNFDFTIIDNAPSLGVFTVCALNLSNLVIIPTKAGSGFSIEGVENAIELIKEMKNDSNPKLNLLRLLINQVDRRTTTSQYTIERLKQSFNSSFLFKTTIPTNAAFEKAELLKQSVFSKFSSSPGARAYRLLAEEVICLLDSK